MSHPRDGAESRAALITTAMQLFAEQGIDAVSVRAVNRAAGLAAAAVHYHFGSKEALVDAAITYHGTELLGDISAACDDLIAGGGRPTPLELVETFSLPYRRLLERAPSTGRHWLSMVAQLIQSDDPRITALAAPVTNKLESLVATTFPEASEAQIRVALRITLVTYIQLLVHDHQQGQPNGARSDALTDFVTGGITAVLGDGSEPVTRSPITDAGVDAA